MIRLKVMHKRGMCLFDGAATHIPCKGERIGVDEKMFKVLTVTTWLSFCGTSVSIIVEDFEP